MTLDPIIYWLLATLARWRQEEKRRVMKVKYGKGNERW